MQTSLFLAKVIGLYFFIISLFVLIRYQLIIAYMRDFLDNRGFLFLNALVTLLIGIILVVVHNIWVLDWRLIITLIAWVIFIGGILRLFLIDKAKSIFAWWLQHAWTFFIVLVIYLLIGLYLMYIGFVAYQV